MKVISAKNAALLDQELMSDVYGFSIDQLMELAGLSVAQAIYKAYPPKNETKKVLIIAGPGNNGGDGLVCARHLKLFGYFPIVMYPKPTEKPIYLNLVKQLKNFNIDVLNDLNKLNYYLNNSDLIVDSMFGFSFKPPIRSPFDTIIKEMLQSKKPIVAVDIPSGWDVDEGPILDEIKNYQPDVLVSLTAPKPCSKFLNLSNSRHFLGGRFIDEKLSDKWGIKVPEYPGVDQVVELGKLD